LRAALQRYRVLANVVGVVLVVFLLVAVPLRYLGGEPRLSEMISPIHGFLYIVYLGVTVDLARRADWTVGRTLLVALAGTVPFLSFVVERRMTRDVETRLAT
jgi:integral membrane protein